MAARNPLEGFMQARGQLGGAGAGLRGGMAGGIGYSMSNTAGATYVAANSVSG